jgi:hypothetical protein
MNIIHRIRMIAIIRSANRLLRANANRRHVASAHMVSYPVPAQAEPITPAYLAMVAIVGALVIFLNVTEQQPAPTYACRATLASK